MVRIAVDAMGGDHAPGVVVEGMIEAASRFGDEEFILVGRRDAILAEFERLNGSPEAFRIVDANDVVEMHDSPVDALRKKPDSSMRRLVSLLKRGECDAIFSAGNTGAMVAASQMLLGLLPEVRRAGIAVTLPRGKSPVVVCDVGANIQCKPLHLFQYAVMASELSFRLYGVSDPGIGLLNVGEEDQKGNALVKETKALFSQSPLRFLGNVEGGDIFHGDADVVVCDGFVGNIVLKTSEGLSEYILRTIADALSNSSSQDLPAEFRSLAKDSFKRIMAQFDYAEYGAAPLLGVDGIVLIGHGRSDARAIVNAIRWAKKFADTRVNEHITERIVGAKA